MSPNFNKYSQETLDSTQVQETNDELSIWIKNLQYYADLDIIYLITKFTLVDSLNKMANKAICFKEIYDIIKGNI